MAGFVNNPLDLAYATSVGIGTGAAAPNYFVQMNAPVGTHCLLQFTNATTGSAASDGCYFGIITGTTLFRIYQLENDDILFATNNVARAYLTRTGGLFIGGAGTYVDPGMGNLRLDGIINSVGGFKRVSTQFDVTASTTLVDVTGLSVNVAAGKTYQFEAVLYTTSNVAGGVKFAIAGTATATAIIYEAMVHNAAAVSAQTRAAALAGAVGGVTAVTVALARITGLITVNAGGTLTVQFAQNASNGAASSVLVGSTFKVVEMV